MSKRQDENRASRQAPALFSFITLRDEAFGALLFNPFLPAEVELDEGEALIARMCNGEHTLSEMREACRDALELQGGSAAAVLEKTLDKLNAVCALQFVDPVVSAGRLSVPVAARSPSMPVTAGSRASLSAPKSVIWDVTYACNLRCRHCLTDSGPRRTGALDREEAFKLIDTLAAAKVLYLSLAGGEPFLRRDILDLLARIADSGMRVDIATNGLDVPERTIKGLRELPIFHIQVSIDGIGADHDRFRGKAGSFENACNALRRFKEEGLSTSISTTVTAQNVDRLPELIDLAVALGCDAFKAIPFIPAGRGQQNSRELWLGRLGSLKMSRILADRSRELSGRISISTESTFLFLLEPPIGDKVNDGPMICSAGYDELSIGADGTAYPCPFLHDFPLGNLLSDSLELIWHESPILNEMRLLSKKQMTGACSTCRFAPKYCRGGCRAAAYLTYGHLNASDPLCFNEFLGSAPSEELSEETSLGHFDDAEYQRELKTSIRGS
jgi:mycofactocin biosynthetic radical S-adenosylmethionine protein MftC